MQVRKFDLRSLDKMLPCPFCGGEAELDTAQGYRAINGHFGNRVVVYCRDCGADQGTCVEDVPDIHPNEVIEQWNKRVAMPQRELLREALEAFVHIEEYWNGSRTDQAMYLALDEIIMTASAAADKIRAALGGEK